MGGWGRGDCRTYNATHRCTINYNNRIESFGSIQILEFIIHFDRNIMLFHKCGEKVMFPTNLGSNYKILTKLSCELERPLSVCRL